MRIGDAVKIIVEIEPTCSCPTRGSYWRGDEFMTCLAHGIKEYKQPNIIKEAYGFVQRFYEETSYSPRTVLVFMDGIGGCQFDLCYGKEYLWELLEPQPNKIVSIRLDTQYLPARLDIDASAKGKTRLVAHKTGSHFSDWSSLDEALDYEDENKNRIPLNHKRQLNTATLPVSDIPKQYDIDPFSDRSWWEKLIDWVYSKT